MVNLIDGKGCNYRAILLIVEEYFIKIVCVIYTFHGTNVGWEGKIEMGKKKETLWLILQYFLCHFVAIIDCRNIFFLSCSKHMDRNHIVQPNPQSKV